jgi:hypothetical protein
MIGNPGPSIGLLPGSPVQDPPAPAPAAGEPSTSGRGSVTRVPVLVVAGAAVLVLAAAGGFVLLKGSGADVTAPGAVASHVARTTSPSAPASAGPTTASGAAVPTGRNPFIGPAATASGAITDPSGSASSTASSTASVTASASAPAATVTRTAAPATYVGLYGFSGSKAVFWVNDTKYQVAAGASFAGFTYTSKTTAGCAMVKHGTTTSTLCPGTVKQLG